MNSSASQTRTAMPVTEKIGLAFALLTAMLLLGFALFSLIVDTIIKFDLYGILVDLIFLVIGIFLGYFSIRIYKKSVYYEGLVSSAFDEGIYMRLEPVLRKIAETSVGMEDVENRLNKIDHMVQTVMEEQVQAGKSPRVEVEKAIAPGTSIGFAIKAIFLTIISMSGFLFMIYTSLGAVHFATLAFYVLWWVLLTSEFRLFNNMAAWMLVFIPILLVPVGFMILDAFFQINNVIALFYGLLALYAFLYFLWAVYETKGTLPFTVGR
jgi:tetrahydromethanopterin S-methyltransferase subunit G